MGNHDRHFTPPFTHQQMIVLALLPKVSGFLSSIFSTYMIYTIVCDKNRTKRIYHRIMFMISLTDLSSGIWAGILSTWPSPKGQGIIWAVGNDTTCSLQGFWTQLCGLLSSSYNGSLSFYYLLAIRYGWKESQLIHYEKFFHGIPLTLGFVTAITGLIMQRYGNAIYWCWVAPEYPKFRYVAFLGPLWIMIFTVTVNTILLWDHVRRIEKAGQKYRFDETAHTFSSSTTSGGNMTASLQQQEQGQQEAVVATSTTKDPPQQQQSTTTTMMMTSISLRDHHHHHRRNSASFTRLLRMSSSKSMGIRNLSQMHHHENHKKKMKRTREVANQSFLYAGTFYFTWFAPTTTRIISQVNGKVYYPLLVIAAITVPIQSLPNLLVYMLPRFRQCHWYQNMFCLDRHSDHHRHRGSTTITSHLHEETEHGQEQQQQQTQPQEQQGQQQHVEPTGSLTVEEEEDKPFDAEHWHDDYHPIDDQHPVVESTTTPSHHLEINNES